MKKKTLDKSKLAAYSSMAIALLASEEMKGQIVYTDIVPNTIIDHNGLASVISEFIDIDNDGTADIEIRSEYISTSSSSGPGYIIKVFPKNETRIDCEKGFFGNFINAEDKQFGKTIGKPVDHWQNFGYLYSFIEPTQDWKDGLEHYLPVRLQESPDTYKYGWIRMRIFGGQSVEIYDYAINNLTNTTINAGQTSPCTDGYENNNNFGTARPVQTNHIYQGLINVGTDKDFFKWTY
ncbi:MAG: hypothetical protein ABI729_07440, partial [Chitinophagales bacterium]